MLPLNYFRLLSQTSHTGYLITHERVRQSLEELEELMIVSERLKKNRKRKPIDELWSELGLDNNG